MKYHKLLFIASIFSINNLYADCSVLDSIQCIEWTQYCEWNEDIGECQEISGDDGPYDYGYLTEADGIRESSLFELDNGDIIIGGYGFNDGNSGGIISLVRLTPLINQD